MKPKPNHKPQVSLASPKIDQTPFEIEKIKWTLRDGNTPMRRIFSTCKHLGSTWSYEQIERLVLKQVDAGLITMLPHPLHEGEFFFALASKEA